MEFLFQHKWTGEVITSLIIIGAFLIVRIFLIRLIKSGPEILTDEQRRWGVRIKNATWIAILIGLFFVWAPQLHTLALSITAFALAVVIATKELLTCLIGGFLRAGTRGFKVGDWLSVEGITGEIIDIDLVGKTYQFTGKSHYVPNSKLLTNSFSKLTFMKTFVIHDVQVTLQNVPADPELLMGKLKEITEKHFAPHHEEAIKFNEEFERVSGLDLHDADPQFFLSTRDFSHVIFTARLLLPTKLAASLESDIILEFLSLVRLEGHIPPPATA